MNIDLRLGDCLEVLKTIPDNSVDSVVTDPPYGIGFMNKEWDNPQKHQELIEREKNRSEERFADGKSPVKGGFSKGVQPGLPIGGAKEGKWFQDWCELWARECFRILKPGGHALSFSAPRTYHRMATAFEDSGFQIRDQIMWVFGSGFPKSHNIGKAIDKIAGRVDMSCDEVKLKLKGLYDKSGKSLSKISEECGFNASGYIKTESNKPDPWTTTLPTVEKWKVISKVINATEEEKDEISNLLQSAEREVIGTKSSGLFNGGEGNSVGGTIVAEVDITIANIEEAKEWEGWGTALKPAHEPIVMARKPLSEKSIAENVLKHGTGGINIDGSRIEMKDKENINFDRPRVRKDQKEYFGNHLPDGYFKNEDFKEYNESGRFPANIIFDEEAGQLLDEQSGTLKGGASRFFYCPKAAKKDRNEGMPEEVGVFHQRPRREDGTIIYKEKNPEEWAEAMSKLPRKDKTSKAAAEEKLQDNTNGLKNNHPTVKPTDLMRYLINLITPPNGVVLDPFMGSGSTGKAAVRCGVNFIGIEKEQEYMDIAKARIEHEKNKPVQGKLL
jgi:DNA modification methylase